MPLKITILVFSLCLLPEFESLSISDSKNKMDDICGRLNPNKNGTEILRRTKRQVPSFSEMWSQVMDYACFDGSLLSCMVTFAKILPTR